MCSFYAIFNKTANNSDFQNTGHILLGRAWQVIHVVFTYALAH